MAGPFVGRTAELEALVETASRATVGGPVAAFVVGDPGVGKSRLLAEASRCVDVPYRFSVAGYQPEREVPRRSSRPRASAFVSARVPRWRSSARAIDRVFFEPGETHWHGAAPDRFMVHIAMQQNDESGSPVTWGEHVTDEEYSAARAD